MIGIFPAKKKRKKKRIINQFRFTAPDDCSRRCNVAGSMSSTSTREIKLYTVEAPERARNLKEETKLEKKIKSKLNGKGECFS